MKPAIVVLGLLATACMQVGWAKTSIGDPVPNFTAVDSTGRTRSLSEFRGKIVVVESTSTACPLVKKHYTTGNLPGQQEKAIADGVVWLMVNSNGAGREGYADAPAAEQFMSHYKAHPTAYLIDADGNIGRSMNIHTFLDFSVIDQNGILRYKGGIDSIASSDADDIPRATQYVRAALGEMAAGRAVSVPLSEPYGCDVNYQEKKPQSDSDPRTTLQY